MNLFLVTDRSDAHVARFDELFSGLSTSYGLVRVTSGPGGEPHAIIQGKKCQSWTAIRDALSGLDAVVVSGPLDTVSTHLVGGDFVHVAMSFATDVMVTAARSEEALADLTTVVSSASYLVTDNYATENAMIALGAEPESIIRIPWGPDNSAGETSLSRADVGWPEDRQIVLYPRSLEPHYDPEVFVAALAELVEKHPRVLAVLVESGSAVDSVKSQIASAGLSNGVHWEPLMTPEDFHTRLSLADVVVVSPRTDGTSVTVMDAMSLGVPVVSSLTAGSSQWVIDGITGWTFPVGNHTELASAIDRALGASRERTELILENARRLVARRAGWDSSSRQLGELLSRLLTAS